MSIFAIENKDRERICGRKRTISVHQKTDITMTTLKKINTLSIVLIAATIIGVGLDFGFKWYDYARGFRDGFTEDSRIESKDTTKTAEVSGAQTGTADTGTATDAQEVGEVNEFKVNENAGEKSGAGEFLGIVAVLTLAIALLVAFVKLVLNYIGVLGTVRRGRIFSEELERRTNHIGIELIVIYVAEWGLTLLLGIDVAQTPSFGVLCCGVGMMIFAQIFALGRKMKEDQEYMV